jgi:aerobic-type carbon monoxide dehydrogenase small subunit (CoxS/CutS family)
VEVALVDETAVPSSPESPAAGGAGGPPENKFRVTRRSFLIGAGAGAATAGVVLGGAVVATKALAPTETTTTATGGGVGKVLPTMRRVALNIDGVAHDLVVDNRESLWQTMTLQLGLASSNLGCDRAQCGACTVLVDGKAVNSCTMMSARLGRGQQIQTVASLPTGSGLAGLHPVQRAFWLNGGFQCGICTRGFIMSTVALLAATPKPTDVQIAEGLSGNICRCGEYAKIFASVKTASAEMAGEKVTYLAAPVLVEAAKKAAAPAGPAVATDSKDFQFATPLSTIEDFDPIANQIKTKDGIVDVSGSERTITIKWDKAKLDEAKVRDILTALGHPAK